MLSICIPTYNFDSRPLLSDLLKQIQQSSEKIELLVMDDASEESVQSLYKELDTRIQFIQLKENVGRSKIRNLLAKEATHDYLLFIDGDSSILSDVFLTNYLVELKKQPAIAVFCGGSVYADQAASSEEMLRWKYSKAREKKSAVFLKEFPYQSFTSNNFIIKKEVFLNILFEERLTQYGHEDTLFGFELKQKGISIQHLNNPVLNGDLDSNTHFLEKTRLGISNLLKILDLIDYDEQFIRLLPLLRTYFKIKLFGLEIFLRWWFKANRKRLEKKFKQGKGSLLAFDFYRLGVLSILFRNQK
jgi:glycosyltransferase involved in cell wall biosynthesis